MEIQKVSYLENQNAKICAQVTAQVTYFYNPDYHQASGVKNKSITS